ncbi:MAG TPA: peroxiredoxin [Pyrinomonadaceae bacterium]|nr:peroxiredoxin [Pyrinomonadaceae bacterium]
MRRTDAPAGRAPRAARPRFMTAALAALFLLAFAGAAAAQKAPPPKNGEPPKTIEGGNLVVHVPVGIEVGFAAPDFKLPYATKEKIFLRPDEHMSLSSLRGKTVVLAFYPADWSSGCTAEVCTFRDTFADLGKLNAVVLGISGDYVFSHHEWAKHHNLPFALLSDHDHKVAREYDSYMEQYGMNKRTVFVIDRDGRVRYANLAFKANDKKDYDALRAEIEKLSAAASATEQ